MEPSRLNIPVDEIRNEVPQTRNVNPVTATPCSYFDMAGNQAENESLAQRNENSVFSPSLPSDNNYPLDGYTGAWGNYIDNFGFPMGTLGDSEELTPEQLGELDAYLNSLSQAQSSTFTANRESLLSDLNGIDDGENFRDISNNLQTDRQLYAETYSQWTSGFERSAHLPSNFCEGTYSPFGIQENNDNYDLHPIRNPSHQETQHSSTNTKLSFAEVARNNSNQLKDGIGKNNLSTKVYKLNERKEQQTTLTGVEIPNSNRAVVKKHKVSKTNSYMKKNKSQVQPADIKPNSRYGLDTFDDRTTNLKEGVCRKNSGSSVSSGLSGMEETHLNDKQHCDQADRKNTSANTSSANCDHHQYGSNSTPLDNDTTRITRSKIKKADTGEKKNVQSDNIYFDPRRIFQDSHEKKSKSVKTNNEDFIPNNKQKIQPDKESLLNKEKSKASVKCGTTKYINNDLRDNKKHTNIDQEQAEQAEQANQPDNYFVGSQGNRDSRSKSSNGSNVQGRNRGKTTTKCDAGTYQYRNGSKISHKKDRIIDNSHLLGYWLLLVYEWTLWFGREFLTFLWSIFKLVLSVALLLFALITHCTVSVCAKAWCFLKAKVPYLKRKSTDDFDWSSPIPQPRHKQYGLKENIVLPSTGNEAMKRLLSCKGKDPYSILGVRGDACDEDIKKYYRKQAVLVHPDKNTQPGAEEAFKILGHAFDLIGSSEKRKEYDAHLERKDAEHAMHEFADLLTKLHDKMQEANNLLRCDNCGGKHKRVPTDRPMYSARFCDRCNTRHAVKEGDVWAESRMLGFLWHYYACMDNKVFDITEWASCKHENFKSMQANAHQVIYRLSTGAGKNKNSSKQGEAKLEDFLNNLFHTANSSNNFGNGEPTAGAAAHTGGNRSQSSEYSNSKTAASKTGGGRKKKNKKH